MDDIYVGTAGWNIPSSLKEKFLSEGTHLQKYSEKLNCVEINSSFYRDHKFETYQKWSQLTPDDFLFSVKLLRYFTHEKRLVETGSILKDSLNNIFGLGPKLGVLLIQLPPSLSFEYQIAKIFFQKITRYCDCPVVLEPRHISWCTSKALNLLEEFKISKALADPEPCKILKSQRPSVEKSVRYFRLHGSPEIYRSNYEPEALNRLYAKLKNPLSPTQQTWIIFDNTTFHFATQNALELILRLQK